MEITRQDKFFGLALLKITSAASGIAAAMYTLDDFINIDQGVGLTVLAGIAYVAFDCAQKYILRPRCEKCYSRLDKLVRYLKHKK